MIQDKITDSDIERLLEESEDWYGYIPKGYISYKLKSFFKDLEDEE